MTRRTIRSAATTSAFAMAVSLAAAPAAGQSFQGSSTVTFGSASVTQGATTTDIDVASPSAVIDWTPSDGGINNGVPIVFQNSGSTATITGVNGDFALLNRIVPADTTRPIIFDGNLVSQFQTGAGLVSGGTVFFYSPGGIIVGSSAVFNVGNLGLTTSPVAVDGSGNWYAGNQVQFGQSVSGTYVAIQGGAQITASAPGSYVAAFAPHVVHSGTIDVDGQAALVAGEAGTITFSPDGLFDIQVSIGSDGDAGGNGLGVFVDGEITGPASSGFGDNHRVYMVAVPKNQAIAIALTGANVGFDVAGAVDTVGNAVVLSAGYNVTAGTVDIAAAPAGGANLASVEMTNGNATSEFSATATGRASFLQNSGTSDFAANATLSGAAPVGSPQIAAQFSSLGTTATVAGDLSIIAGSATPPANGASETAQEARLEVYNAGSIQVGGGIVVDASAIGYDTSTAGGVGGTGTAGTAGVIIGNGGTITAGSDIEVLANGSGGFGLAGGADGGAGIGGDAFILVNGSGPASIDATFVNVRADGTGGAALGATGTGGAATGGLARLSIGANLTVATGIEVSADAVGGDSVLSGDGGAATGGHAVVHQTAGTLDLQSYLDVNVEAYGGFGGSTTGDGGAAAAGFAEVLAQGGSVNVASDLFVESTAVGGGGFNGGDATGSLDSLTSVNAFATARAGSLTVQGVTFVSTDVIGGDGTNGGAGGSAMGGASVVLAETDAGGVGSLVALGDLYMAASASGGFGGDAASGAGGAGGAAAAGSAEILGDAGNGQLVITGSTQAIANGEGGLGGDGDVGGIGGSASGGVVRIGTRDGPATADNTGSATFADVQMFTGGAGGEGGAGATGAGGDGGDGTNGLAVVLVRGSPVTVTGPLSMLAYGIGGMGGVGATVTGNGGDGYAGGDGGIAIIASSRTGIPAHRGNLVAGDISGQALAVGGDGAIAGTAFVGDGPAQIAFNGADATITSLGFSVSGDQVTATVTDLLNVRNATVDIGDFLFVTPNHFRLIVDGGTVNSDTFAIQARSLLLPTSAPTAAGVVNVTSGLSLTVDPGESIRTYTGFNTAFGVTFVVDGAFQTGAFTAAGDFYAESLAGDLTFAAINADNVQVFAGGAITVGTLTSPGSVFGSAGTVVNVDGAWQASDIALESSDIVIAPAGSLTADAVSVFSTSAAGVFVGDNAGGSGGYRLDNGEFGRISATEIGIFGTDTTNLIDMTIGDLTIDGTPLGADGTVDFDVYDVDSGSASGGIRVNGAIVGTNFADFAELDFDSSLFELNAETGSVSLGGATSGSLGGTIEIETANIHVASEAILQKLRADAFYEGHAAELNAAGDVNRPEGVLRAFGLQLLPRETLYIQNTGSAANPAGFYTTVENSDIEPPGFEDPAAPDVEVVINGRFQGPSGDVSGRDAYDLLVANAESDAGFTATSQINGCTLGGDSCATISPGEEESAAPPTNAAQIEVLTQDQAQEEPFDIEEEEEAEQAARAPIAPPVVLIDSRPLNPDADVTDPVSGTGNPALIGASISENAAPSVQGDEQ